MCGCTVTPRSSAIARRLKSCTKCDGCHSTGSGTPTCMKSTVGDGVQSGLTRRESNSSNRGDAAPRFADPLQLDGQFERKEMDHISEFATPRNHRTTTQSHMPEAGQEWMSWLSRQRCLYVVVLLAEGM